MSQEQGDFDERAGGGSGPPWKLLTLLVVVAAMAVFFFQNGERVRIHFLWMDGEWPVWLIIGISVGAGVIIDRLGTWQWRRARNR